MSAPKPTGVQESLDSIIEHTATKSDIAALSGQVTSIEQELKTIRRDLDHVKEKFENASGYRKETRITVRTFARRKAIKPDTGVLAFECALSNLTSDDVYSFRSSIFFFVALLAI